MNSLMIFGRQFLPFVLLIAIALYIVLLIVLTIFRFGLYGISAKNIGDMMLSRTMRIFFAIYVIIVLLFTVESFLLLKKSKKEQQEQQQFQQQFNERINEQLKELKKLKQEEK